MKKYEPDDYYQMKWDNLLINSMFKDNSINRIVVMFKIDNPECDLNRLLRFPSSFHFENKYLSINTFIANYLPKLNSYIYDHDKKDILFMLMQSKIDTSKVNVNYRKNTKEANVRNVEMKKDKTNYKEGALSKEWRHKINRSNQWNVVK